MKPLWSYVLVRIKKTETKVGGIVVPGQENTKTAKGVVVAVGDSTQTLKVGQTVWVDKESYFPVDVKGETLYVLEEMCVLGVCSDE
tara:strand:+ start:753 stop:1010 length:258 start_codon:yes stop_codon:yes gene_type:complete